ncbi:hypothetical protein [Streptomyces luteolifulvus]|uniref:hypothetical protein n=1 Tax=Streptomyces luteolifulvus TaxID=2615112 RepID=UPI001CD9E50A|nr:hypothetical protein [Streptomyces luteolifulvus]
MIRPTLTADGLAVRLPIADRAEQLLDSLALAYAEHPDDVGALLATHAANVVRLDHAVVSEDMPEYERSMRAAAADGTREALLAEAPPADSLDDLLDPDDALTLAQRIAGLAAHIDPRAAVKGMQHRAPSCDHNQGVHGRHHADGRRYCNACNNPATADGCAHGNPRCGAQPVRPYPCGWRCDDHQPARTRPYFTAA